jgi:hypothetical protein
LQCLLLLLLLLNVFTLSADDCVYSACCWLSLQGVLRTVLTLFSPDYVYIACC